MLAKKTEKFIERRTKKTPISVCKNDNKATTADCGKNGSDFHIIPMLQAAWSVVFLALLYLVVAWIVSFVFRLLQISWPCLQQPTSEEKPLTDTPRKKQE